MATNIVTLSRPVSTIVTDLATTRQRITTLYARPDPFTDDEHAMIDALEDRRTALETEFDTALYAATGVAWDMLERVRA